jgi:uncharacterized protein
MPDEITLSDELKRKLLAIARETVRAKISDKKKAEFEIDEPQLRETGGAFVTLKKRGQLRGCIGNFFSPQPIYLTIRDMAIAAATEDPRFPAVKISELDELELEISVLSPLREINSLDEIEVGQHGIYITRGFSRGVLLPQVATEWGWDRDTFLDHTCLKAGLAKNTWRSFGQDKDLKIEIFSAQVFGDEDV